MHGHSKASSKDRKLVHSGDRVIDGALAQHLHLGLSEVLSAMPKILKSTIAASVLAVGLWFASGTPSFAKPKYATTEGKACIYCHVTAGKPGLNEAGNYYAAHDHSLKGYTPGK